MASLQRVCQVALVLLALAAPAFSWGFQGHAIVCAIAQGLLSDTALTRVKSLLPSWASGYMPAVCSWPDVIGHTKAGWHWSLPLHYIDTPDGLCNYDFSRDCHSKCVAAAILNYTQQLTDLPPVTNTASLRGGPTTPLPPSLSSLAATMTRRIEAQSARGLKSNPGLDLGTPWVEDILSRFRRATSEEGSESEVEVREVGEEVMQVFTGGAGVGGGGSSPKDEYDPSVFNPTVALMFLVHFVGDIHQPLHVGFTKDYGGNRIKVHWYKKKTNLHEVWDTEIIKEGMFKFHGSNITSFVLSLAQRLTTEWAGNIKDWVACDGATVCPNKFASESIGDACKWAYTDVVTGDTLGDAYFDPRFPVVEVELAKAGVRLAATLMRLFDPAPADATTFTAEQRGLRVN